MATEACSYFGGQLFKFGRQVQKLLQHADEKWSVFYVEDAEADYPGRETWKLRLSLDNSLGQLLLRASDAQLGDRIRSMRDLVGAACDDFLAAWRERTKAPIIKNGRFCNANREPIASEGWPKKTPLSSPPWCACMRAMADLVAALPDPIANCFLAGRLVEQVWRGPVVADKLTPALGTQFAVSALWKALEQMQATFGILAGIDVQQVLHGNADDPDRSAEVRVAAWHLAEEVEAQLRNLSRIEHSIWSKPMPPFKIAKLFDWSYDTLTRRIKDGGIHIRKLSTKSWQLLMTDWPANATIPATDSDRQRVVSLRIKSRPSAHG